jgi:hypothetical protein
MKSASPDIVIQFGPQGTSPLPDISQWILSDVPVGDEGMSEDGTAYGHTHVQNLMVGISNQADITLEGFFEDEDNGPDDVFGTISGPNTDPYTLLVTWTAGSPPSTSSVPVHIKSYQRLGKVKAITRFRVVLLSAGPSVHTRQGG